MNNLSYLSSNKYQGVHQSFGVNEMDEQIHLIQDKHDILRQDAYLRTWMVSGSKCGMGFAVIQTTKE